MTHLNFSADEHVRAQLRRIVAEKGRPIRWDEYERANWPDTPQTHVSVYGWVDYEADWHVRREGCHWVVPAGVVAVEQTYAQFQDTFVGAKDEIGVNVSPVACACGRYADMTLRYESGFGDLISEVVGAPPMQPHIVL